MLFFRSAFFLRSRFLTPYLTFLNLLPPRSISHLDFLSCALFKLPLRSTHARNPWRMDHLVVRFRILVHVHPAREFSSVAEDSFLLDLYVIEFIIYPPVSRSRQTASAPSALFLSFFHRPFFEKRHIRAQRTRDCMFGFHRPALVPTASRSVSHPGC